MATKPQGLADVHDHPAFLRVVYRTTEDYDGDTYVEVRTWDCQVLDHDYEIITLEEAFEEALEDEIN